VQNYQIKFLFYIVQIRAKHIYCSLLTAKRDDQTSAFSSYVEIAVDPQLDDANSQAVSQFQAEVKMSRMLWYSQ